MMFIAQDFHYWVIPSERGSIVKEKQAGEIFNIIYSMFSLYPQHTPQILVFGTLVTAKFVHIRCPSKGL